MSFFVRSYLRASTTEQDAQRARVSLETFARERDLVICSHYIENISGARLDRPELFRLLNDSRPNDVLLVEDIDRLSRLTASDWEKLKSIIRTREVRIVALNVPTTWQHLLPAQHDFDARMYSAINGMLLDMLAAFARRDYDQRRERQNQGIAKAKESGKYKGTKANSARYATILVLLKAGRSWSTIETELKCSRSTISSAIRHEQSKVSTPNE